jgi:hypothetical protein
MSLNDFPLEHPSPPPGATSPLRVPSQPAGPSAPTRWVVVGAVAIIAIAVLGWWWMSRARPDSAIPAPTGTTDVAVFSKRPTPQYIDLPSLDASDQALAEMIATLSEHPLLTRFLTTKALARNSVLAIVQIGDGKTPATPLATFRPTSRLTIVGNDESGRIDPASYNRWDGATNALVNIDIDKLAQVYVNVKTLLDQAYRELGHPNGDFDEALVRAINTLDETPQVPADPMLLPRPNRGHPTYYEHNDPALRSLLPVQKQMLLIGPENRRKVMGWLRRLATKLELKIG